MSISTNNPSNLRAYIITGSTSGFGRATAFEVARHGTVVLVGRDQEKLGQTQRAIAQKTIAQKTIAQESGYAVPVVCDLSDLGDVRRAAAEIINLNLPLAGLVNNAGIMQMRPTKSAQGLDMSYATNHLGPFLLTEALRSYQINGMRTRELGSRIWAVPENRYGWPENRNP